MPELTVLNSSPHLTDPRANSKEDEEFQAFLKGAYEYAPRLHLDTESNGKEIRSGEGYLIGISIDYEVAAGLAYSYYFPFRHATAGNLSHSYLSELKKLIETSGKAVVAQNARFDIMSAETAGITIPGNFEDTMLLAHSVDENKLSYSLDSLAKGLGYDGKARDKDLGIAIKFLGWDGIPPTSLSEYAAVDASLLRPIYNHYKPRYDKEDESNGELWENDKKFMLVLNKIEKRGAKVNLQLAEEELERGEKRMVEISNDLGLNPGSRNDLEHLLIDTLGLPVVKRSKKTDKPSFDKQAMQEYEELLQALNSPVAKQVLEYRGYQKATSSYWKAYLEHVGPDGRIRPNFNLHRTLTHRLSCDTPNLQQIPRVTAKPWNRLVKSGFIPEDGWELWEADYSQLEMRLTAAYAREERLLEVFRDDSRDLFNEMASALGLDRDPTKTLNYALGYGAGVNKVASMLGVSRSAAQQIKDNYFETWPGIAKITQMASSHCRGKGLIRTWSKRVRHFSDPNAEAHKAFNSVIQGGAADIVKRRMIELDNQIDPEECRMVLQVHDSVWFEIQKGKVQKYKPQIINIMEDVQPDFGVPFRVDFHPVGGWDYEQAA